jgi:hypothetical protein
MAAKANLGSRSALAIGDAAAAQESPGAGDCGDRGAGGLVAGARDAAAAQRALSEAWTPGPQRLRAHPAIRRPALSQRAELRDSPGAGADPRLGCGALAR